MKKRDRQIELNKIHTNAVPSNEWMNELTHTVEKGGGERIRKLKKNRSRALPSFVRQIFTMFYAFFVLFFFYLSVALIVFDFSLSLRRLLPPSCHYNSRCEYTERTNSTAASARKSFCAWCTSENVRWVRVHNYVLFVVMIFQSNEIGFILFTKEEEEGKNSMPTHSNKVSFIETNHLSFKIEINHIF